MADKVNEKLGVSFQLPDRVSVRQQLAYISSAGLATGNELFEKLWYGARAVVTGWKCEALPDINTDLDSITDPKATEIILWTGLEVKQYMDRLDTVPKNS
jgi:hypothetical protein